MGGRLEAWRAQPPTLPEKIAKLTHVPSKAERARSTRKNRWSVRVDQNFAVFGTIRRTDHAAFLHHFHDLGGPVVADGHLALQPGGRAALSFGDDPHRFVEARV